MTKNKKPIATLLWYDYETWGTSPAHDGIAQFAAQRTDMALNPIADPINLYCQPTCDRIIDPQAVLVTGLSPTLVRDAGLPEFAFAKKIQEEMSVPGTCTVGYNSIRFDDECTRFLFYRNLLDPYAREWQNGNSRWDLIDLVRMTHALRPQGMTWPVDEDGIPTFKLERLSQANALTHQQAHDASSDVVATIALAKKIKDCHPDLFNFAFNNRSKQAVRQQLDLADGTPHLHFTGKVAAAEYCMGIEVPLIPHPHNANEIVVLDIREDPSWLMQLDADTVRERLYKKSSELAPSERRPPLKTIRLNRCPAIAPIHELPEATARALGIDRKRLQDHQQWVRSEPRVRELARAVFGKPARPPGSTAKKAEQALYERFIGPEERRLLERMVNGEIAKSDWLRTVENCADKRLPVLIETWLARHCPEALDASQYLQWRQRRTEELHSKTGDSSLTLPEALKLTEQLSKAQPQLTALRDTLDYLVTLSQHWAPPNSLAIKAVQDTSEGDKSPASTTRPAEQLQLF